MNEGDKNTIRIHCDGISGKKQGEPKAREKQKTDKLMTA